jgi:hypothetical protein
MKQIKLIWLLLVFTGVLTSVKAQSSLIIDASQQFTSIRFTDTQGKDLNSEYSGTFTGAYNIGYRFISKGGFLLNSTIGMRKAGTTMVYDEMNYVWNLQYLNTNLGLGYMLINDVASPYLSISGYYAYLLRGFQTINNEDYDITKTESLSRSDIGMSINPGIQLSATQGISTYIEFNYILGLKNIEADENQEAKNFAYGFTLGFSLLFNK